MQHKLTFDDWFLPIQCLPLLVDILYDSSLCCSKTIFERFKLRGRVGGGDANVLILKHPLACILTLHVCARD